MKTPTEIIHEIQKAETKEQVMVIGNYIMSHKKDYCIIDLQYIVKVHKARFKWVEDMERCTADELIQQAKDLLNP